MSVSDWCGSWRIRRKSNKDIIFPIMFGQTGIYFIMRHIVQARMVCAYFILSIKHSVLHTVRKAVYCASHLVTNSCCQICDLFFTYNNCFYICIRSSWVFLSFFQFFIFLLQHIICLFHSLSAYLIRIFLKREWHFEEKEMISCLRLLCILIVDRIQV